MSSNSQASLFAPLICVERVDETADASSFVFQAANQLPIHFKPGQFITFAVDVADETLHRAYSLSSSPTQPERVAITVKRVGGGKVSNHLLDHLRPGLMLPGMSPAGEFNAVDCQRTDKVLLFSAGCGITPCLSIARWLLDTAPETEIQFVHSARHGEDVIKAAELDWLNEVYPNFTLHRVLGVPARQGDHQGRLDQALFDLLVPNVDGRCLFTCGPSDYMDAVKSFALGRGLSPELFHQESFMPPSANDESGSGALFQLQVPKFGKAITVEEGQTLLMALESAGVPIIGACRTGVCGSCKCKIVDGEVTHSSVSTLTDAEVASGYRLACSSQIRSDLVVEIS